MAADPFGTWQTPTWQALGFPPPRASGRAFTEGQPHAFSFAFDSTLSPARSSFVAHAHGDLDGNGVMSTFELRGHDVEGDPGGAAVEPGLYGPHLAGGIRLENTYVVKRDGLENLVTAPLDL